MLYKGMLLPPYLHTIVGQSEDKTNTRTVFVQSRRDQCLSGKQASAGADEVERRQTEPGEEARGCD